jgi:hypothetical protein
MESAMLCRALTNQELLTYRMRDRAWWACQTFLLSAAIG